jgi:hypothetical protein
MTSQKNKVSMAKYIPVTLTNGKATTAATNTAANPDSGKAAQNGKASFFIRIAEVYAPIPVNAMLPMEICPTVAIARRLLVKITFIAVIIRTCRK